MYQQRRWTPVDAESSSFNSGGGAEAFSFRQAAGIGHEAWKAGVEGRIGGKFTAGLGVALYSLHSAMA